MNILHAAEKLVNGNRDRDYDSPYYNFKRITQLWNAYMQAKEIDCKFTKGDVAALMILVKISRQIHKHKSDNLIDIAGYAQCWELVEDENSTSTKQ